MIEFTVSAPGRLNLLGEHTAKYGTTALTTSIDLRTTLTFTELALPLDSVQMNFLQMNIYFTISVQEFLSFYCSCNKNIEILHSQVLQFINNLPMLSNCPLYRKVIIQAFCYLLVHITYREQVNIKSFNMDLSTKLMVNEEFICPASFTVCLATCLLHWSHLQKGIHEPFSASDLRKICSYATLCEKIFPESGTIDVIACTHGSLIEYKIRDAMCMSIFKIPPMPILLVDTKQTQNLENLTQQIARLMKEMSPAHAYSFLNGIDTATTLAANAFRKLLDIYKNNELDIQTKKMNIMQYHKVIMASIYMNQNFLKLLNVSHTILDKLCLIAENYGLSGKYTDIGGGRYAYIWYPENLLGTQNQMISEISTRLNCDVKETTVACCGVTIE